MGQAQIILPFINTKHFVFLQSSQRNGVLDNLKSNISNLQFKRGRFGFDSIDLCRCKHVVRCVISTLI
jgi:hypothetical protein